MVFKEFFYVHYICNWFWLAGRIWIRIKMPIWTKWKMLYGFASQRWGSVTREVSKAVLRIRDMLARIRIRGSVSLNNGSGSVILVNDLQDGKKSQNSRNQGLFLLFLLDDRRIWRQIQSQMWIREAQKHTDPDPVTKHWSKDWTALILFVLAGSDMHFLGDCGVLCGHHPAAAGQAKTEGLTLNTQSYDFLIPVQYFGLHGLQR